MKTLKTLVRSMMFMGCLSGLPAANATSITPAGTNFNSHATMTLETPGSLGNPIKCIVALAGMVAADGQSAVINQAIFTGGADPLCNVTTAQGLPWTMKNFSTPSGSYASGVIQGVNLRSVSTMCAVTPVTITVAWNGSGNQFSLPITQTVGNCKLREFSFQPSPPLVLIP